MECNNSTKTNCDCNSKFEMPEVKLPSFQDNTFNIIEFGGINNGITLNTTAFNNAINACSSAGGGKVIVPAGVWLTGSIELKNNVNLHLEKGALVLFSSNYDDFPLIVTTYEGTETVRCMSQIYGRDLENIAITGDGVFDGSGEVWRAVKKAKLTESQWNNLVTSGGVVNEKGTIWFPTVQAMNGNELVSKLLKEKSKKIEDYIPARDFLRPTLLGLSNCKKVLLDGPSFQNSPSWCLHPFCCEHITIKNIFVKNPWYAQNGDALDLESCKYANILNSLFDAGDDAICLKSGKDEAGRLRGKPSEFVRIKDCEVHHGHGAFVIGSEMSGGVKNVEISDCTFLGTDVGLRFKSTRGRGGVVENIYISNIRMKGIPGDAINFNMYYSANPSNDNFVENNIVSERTPIFRNIHIDNVVCVGANKAVHLEGLPEMPIENITLNNVVISSKQGVTISDGKNIELNNVTVVPEKGAAFTIKNGENIKADKFNCLKEVETFLQVSGEKTCNVKFTNTDTSIAKNKVSFDNGIESSVVTGI